MKYKEQIVGWAVMFVCALLMCHFASEWHIAFRAVILVAWTLITSNYAYEKGRARGLEKASETMVDRENVILILNKTAKNVMAQTAANIFAEMERRNNPDDQHLSREEYRDAIIQKATDQIMENLEDAGDFYQ